jgi:hypothetical protein
MSLKSIRDPLAAAGLALVLLCTAGQAANAQAMTAKKESIPDQVWQRMQGSSWHPNLNCPARKNLALLTVPYLDFSGQPRLGQLVVARSAADLVADVFTEIFKSKKFRIERMELIDVFGGNDDASMQANNTSAFNCRLKTGGTSLSAHSFGTAIDINPVQNPFVTEKQTLPPAGQAFDEPSERAAGGMGVITSGDVVTKAFKKRGWKWGGDWKKPKDYQHFSKDGT